jgi:hypothetical protein
VPYPHTPASMAFAVAALAATVLVLSRPIEAKVIYTPVNVTILNRTYGLDVNNDGTADFKITEANSRFRFGCVSIDSGSLSIASAAPGPNGVEGTGGYASALSSGSAVGQGTPFIAPAAMESVERGQKYVSPGRCAPYAKQSGNWLNKTAYLGMSFEIQGKTHYGWAQVSVVCIDQCGWLTATLTGYAYETIPGKSIKAGQTS